MYYKIADRLVESTMADCLDGHTKYVAVLTPDEWKKDQANFRMGIEMEIERHPHTTKAEVNYDSLTGSFSIPSRHNLTGRDHEFAFALDENGVVLIDEEGYARNIVLSISRRKKWHVQALERFLYDFLESIIRGDSTLLEAIEDELQHMEEDILEGRTEKESFSRISEIRGDLLALRTHYMQMIAFGQELSDNENEFFAEQNLRYFDMFPDRCRRLQDIVTTLRDYSVQVRDLYQSQLAVRQNNTVTILTVITTIFMPLTLIVGWYGMNFKYMPELESPYAYPLVIAVSLLIIVASLLFFKYKKWL